MDGEHGEYVDFSLNCAETDLVPRLLEDELKILRTLSRNEIGGEDTAVVTTVDIAHSRYWRR